MISMGLSMKSCHRKFMIKEIDYAPVPNMNAAADILLNAN